MDFSLTVAVRKITTLLPGSTVIYENLVSFCEVGFGTHLRAFSPCSYAHVLTFPLQFSSKKPYFNWVSLISESSLKWKVLKRCVKCRLVNCAMKMDQKLAIGKGMKNSQVFPASSHMFKKHKSLCNFGMFHFIEKMD